MVQSPGVLDNSGESLLHLREAVLCRGVNFLWVFPEKRTRINQNENQLFKAKSVLLGKKHRCWQQKDLFLNFVVVKIK